MGRHEIDKVWDSLNLNANLVDFEGNSLRDVLDQIAQINMPTRIIAMYGMNGKHYAAVQTSAMVQKVTRQASKENKNGNSNGLS